MPRTAVTTAIEIQNVESFHNEDGGNNKLSPPEVTAPAVNITKSKINKEFIYS